VIPPSFRRIAVIALGALTLTHCADNPVSGGKDFVLMSEQQERQTGAQSHQQVLKEYPALVKRPVLVFPDGRVVLGFKDAQYKKLFSA